MPFLKKNILSILSALLFCCSSVLAQDSFSIKDYVQLNAIGSAGDYAPFGKICRNAF